MKVSSVQNETGTALKVSGNEIRVGAARALALQGNTVEVVRRHVICRSEARGAADRRQAERCTA